MGDLSFEKMEEFYVNRTDFLEFEEACVNHADQIERQVHHCEEVTTVVVTREEFFVKTNEGMENVPEGTYLVGEVDFPGEFENESEIRQRWNMKFSPPDKNAPVSMPIVSGKFFGRDSSVCMVPFILDTDASPEELQTIYDQLVEQSSSIVGAL